MPCGRRARCGARPRAWRQPPGRTARPAARRARSGARPPRPAKRAASRRRGWRSRASGGPRSAAGAVAPSPCGAGACRRGRTRPLRGDALDEAHQLDVEERHAQLEARGHRHLVVADQDAVGEEHAGVEVERLLEQAAAGDVAEHGLGQRRGARPSRLRARAAEQAARDARVGDLDQAQQALGVAASAEQAGGAAGALGARERSGGGRSRRGERRRDEPRGPSTRGGLVAAVAAERLVGALAGEHDLDLLGGEARRAAASAGADGMPQGSSRRGIAARELGEEVGLAPSRCRGGRCRSGAALSAAALALVEHVAVAGEADRERGRRLVRSAAAIAATTAAESTPPREEGAVGDVGHHLALDRVGEALGELAASSSSTAPSSGSPGRLAPALDPRRAVLLGDQRRGRRGAC